MLNYLKQEANKTVTENGAATHITTESDCLDLFATIGALRRESDSEIVTRFVRAYSENRDIAMKLLFFARDIRGGLGERRVFKVILNWLADNEPESVRKNIEYVSERGIMLAKRKILFNSLALLINVSIAFSTFCSIIL